MSTDSVTGFDGGGKGPRKEQRREKERRMEGNERDVRSPRFQDVDMAVSSQLRHVWTIGKKLIKQQYLLYMS